MSNELLISEFRKKILSLERVDLFDYLEAIPEFAPLVKTEQNPKHHAEGNVLIHTNMAMSCAYTFIHNIHNYSFFPALKPSQLLNIYVGTLLHDFGKPTATFLKEPGKLVAYNHETIGLPFARDFMRKYFPEFGFARREWILNLVENHMKARDVCKEGKLSTIRRFSLDVNTAEMFGVAVADSYGRIVKDEPSLDGWERLYIKRMKEENLLNNFFELPFDSTQLNNFEYKNLLWKVLFEGWSYEDSKQVEKVKQLMALPPFQIIMLVGAPGSGKTSYRTKLYPHVPVICMDDERLRLCGNELDMTKNVEVFNNCFGRLCAAMRARQSIVWDATNIDRKYRRKLLDVVRKAGALIEMVYFDIPLEVLQARNAGRSKVVPDFVVEGFYKRLVSPKSYEYDVLRVVDEKTRV